MSQPTWSCDGKNAVRIVLAVGLLLLSACAAGPAQKVTQQAENAGFESAWTYSDKYRHRVFRRGDVLVAEEIEVYLDGDGRPWRYGRYIADDPTPPQSMALALMASTDRPAVYVGRPCYVLDEMGSECEPRLWTSARYSREVVDSLAAVIRHELAGTAAKVTLVGYSGGGALAVLLAQQLPNIGRVVTVAGNLDTDAWIEKHRYLPMPESANPMNAVSLSGITHIHFAGGADENIDKDWINAFSARHGGRYIEVEGYDHRCCWQRDWPQLVGMVRDDQSDRRGYKVNSLTVLQVD